MGVAQSLLERVECPQVGSDLLDIGQSTHKPKLQSEDPACLFTPPAIQANCWISIQSDYSASLVCDNSTPVPWMSAFRPHPSDLISLAGGWNVSQYKTHTNGCHWTPQWPVLPPDSTISRLRSGIYVPSA